MASQTSDKRNNDTRLAVSGDMFDRILGVDDKRHGKCEKHGDFIEVHCSGDGKASKGWKGCPECQQEQRDAEVRAQAVREQQEREQRRLERLLTGSGVPPRFRDKTFENFKAADGKQASNLRKIREYADAVCSDGHGGRSLVMMGKVGTGKTHLGCALLQYAIRATQQACHYWTFAELVRAVKGSFAKGSDYSEQDIYNDFAAPRLVVLDEVGIQNFTDFEQAVAYEAINHRYLAEKPTVLITNLQAADLPMCVGERVVDRLREGGGRALDFDWKSYRSGGAV